MVGPGALPLQAQRSKTRPGTIVCFTGSAIKWKTLTPFSIVNGRSGTSGVVTGTGVPEADDSACPCCDLAVWANAAAPAPNPRTFLKNLLRGFIPTSLLAAAFMKILSASDGPA